MSAEIIKLKPTRPCPICKKPSSQHHHPFCSARCHDIDLNRWLSGSYVIPAEPVEDDNEDGPAKPGQREDDED